jgi:hypothetical protein
MTITFVVEATGNASAVADPGRGRRRVGTEGDGMAGEVPMNHLQWTGCVVATISRRHLTSR